MIKTIVLFALCFWGLKPNAVARLWETEQQLAARYGSSIKKVEQSPDGGKFYTYRFKEYNILVRIIGGISQNEYYTRQDGKPLNSGQRSFFLDENSFGQRWYVLWGFPIRLLGPKFIAISRTYNKVPGTNSPGLGSGRLAMHSE